MGITSITTDLSGEIGVKPRIIRIASTDSFATITTAGYLNGNGLSTGYSFYPTDLAAVTYANNATAIFKVSITAGVITLIPNDATIILPVVDGDFAVFSGTTGSIDDRGFSPSDATKSKVVMASAAVLANHIACFADTAGTVNDDAATAINGGNIQAGLSGTAGAFISYPATATTGSLSLVAVANSGNYANVINNAACGQAVTWTLADPADATSNIVQCASPLVTGNLVKASGTAGLVADAGAKLLAGTVAWAGGGATNAFTVAGITTTGGGSACIDSSANAVTIEKITSTANTLTVLFSGDPGAMVLRYLYTTAAQT